MDEWIDVPSSLPSTQARANDYTNTQICTFTHLYIHIYI